MMDQQKYDKVLKLIYENKIRLNIIHCKQKFLKKKIGKSWKEIWFPIEHLLYLPLQISSTTINHLNNAKRI